MNIYCDGSGWNGESVSYCVLMDDGTCIEEVFEHYKTSMEMEYMAILAALERANPGDIVFSDCAIAVNQLTKDKDVKSPVLREMCERAARIMHPKVKIRKVRRERNKAGIYLERKKKHKKVTAFSPAP